MGVCVTLVDGTYELFRAYYGAPSAQSRDGREVGATRALLATLNSLLSKEGATHVAVAFDHVIESFRNALYPGYKTGAGIEPALRAQFELAEEAAGALGVVVWPMVEYEADDALATGAARYAAHPEVDVVRLCSPDKDLAQCVRGRRVVMVDRRRKIELDEAGVIAKFGVPPASIPDFLALVGDSADGYPGIPRWGARSSAALLAAHGTIDAIPSDPAAWGAKVRGARELSASLEAHRDTARLFKQLATLRTDVPIAEPLEALSWSGAVRARLEPLVGMLGNEPLLDRIALWR